MAYVFLRKKFISETSEDRLQPLHTAIQTRDHATLLVKMVCLINNISKCGRFVFERDEGVCLAVRPRRRYVHGDGAESSYDQFSDDTVYLGAEVGR